ncbi:MAG: serine/threonine-protein kinase, partial [Acidobacteriota bacterium]
MMTLPTEDTKATDRTLDRRSGDRQVCPRCQSPIPSHLEDGLCPACWLSQAADGALDDETLDWPTAARPAADPGGDASGERLGDYHLERRLGRGGMGEVYEARHVPTGRRVALKRLGGRIGASDLRQRFLREGRLAASVSHPNSLYVFGSEEIDGAPVITMEVADGGTLQDELTKKGPLDVKRGVDAMLDVVAGLEAAHTVGVLHRDVKPSNCFVDPDGSVKVGDYGLSISTHAREESYLTESSQILGTPAFASPEQLRGDALDLRADIYSVGATLFTLLTDRAPFRGENAVQVVANVLNQPPAALRDLRSEIPAGLDAAVGRCLAKDPDGASRATPPCAGRCARSAPQAAAHR